MVNLYGAWCRVPEVCGSHAAPEVKRYAREMYGRRREGRMMNRKYAANKRGSCTMLSYNAEVKVDKVRRDGVGDGWRMGAKLREEY